jgi:hypothetical protein
LSRLCRSLPALCFAFAVLSAATPTHAAAGVHAVHCKGVTVSSGVLRIDGVLSDPESFRGVLRVKATRKGRKPYFLPNGELVSTTTSIERRIPPGKVEIANPAAPLPFDPKKTKGRWRSIPVTVKDVRFTGTYKGGLELGSGGCKVEFRLSAAGGAEISLVGTPSASAAKAVKLKLVRCSYLTCGLCNFIEWLNSSSSRRDSVRVQVDNASQSPAVVTGVQIALNTEVGEEVVSKEAFIPTKQRFKRSAQHATTLPPISINRDKIDPGHYTGAIYLQIEGAEKRAVLPFEIDVKDGPFWAIVLLFAALGVHGIRALSKKSKVEPNTSVGRGVYVLRWLIRIVLVGAFVLAGLKELYFSNATFGAQPVADYAALFLWGLSAAALDILVGKFLPGSATT